MSLAPSLGNGRPEAPAESAEPRVAYVMSRFPKITETFILYEMLALEGRGIRVSVYPLQRERTNVTHPEAAAYVERAHFTPFLSWPILRSHLHYLGRSPIAYLGVLAALLGSTLGSARYFLGALAFFPKMVHFARLMEAEGIDHVHAHFASHPAATAFVVRRLTGIPFSFTAHGSDLHRDQTMLREKVGEAAWVVPISEFNRRVIVDVCGEESNEKLIVIHCGTDTRIFRPMEARNPDLPMAFRIVCVGTLHEVKGQRHLIEACRILVARGHDVECHFVGDGEDLTLLGRIASKAGLTERTRFHGRKQREEVASLVREADAVAAPSVPTQNGRREGIPVVLMEAMACGVPVVASRISGIPELVEDGESGILVPPGDVDALANALERLILDRDFGRRLGSRARAQVMADFDVTTNAASLARLFRKGR